MFPRIGAWKIPSRNWVLACVVVLSLGLGGWFVGRLLFPGAEPAGPIVYCYEPGERWHYRLRYSGAGFMNVQAALGGQNPAAAEQVQSIQTVIEGDLFIDVAQADPQRTRLAYSLQNPEVVLVIGGQPLLDALTMKSDLEHPVFVDVDRQGRMETLRFAPEVGELSRHSWRSLLSGIQCVVPEDADASAAYEAWEDAPMGRCRAVYQPDADAPRGTIGILKSRQEYQAQAKKLMPNAPGTTIHPGGELRIAFDPRLGQIRSLTGTELMILKAGGKIISRSEATISLEFVKRDVLAPADLVRIGALDREHERSQPAESLVAAVASPRTRLLAQKQELGDDTSETVLANLARAENSAEPQGSQTPLYLKIKALVAVHPETSPRFAELLHKAELQSLTMRLVPTALAAIGHPEAQTALVDVLRRRQSDEASVAYLVPILARLKSPSPEAENALRHLAHSASPAIMAIAELGLGSMAGHLKATAPQRSAGIVSGFVQELKSVGSEERLTHLLLVLGNSGASDALPAIQEQVRNKSVGVRVAAVAALRFIEIDQAEILMLEALASDADAEVREAVVHALPYRAMNDRTFRALATTCQSDKGVGVRLAALNFLWQLREQFPEVTRLTTTAAESDSSDAVRDAAARLLGKRE